MKRGRETPEEETWSVSAPNRMSRSARARLPWRSATTRGVRSRESGALTRDRKASGPQRMRARSKKDWMAAWRGDAVRRRRDVTEPEGPVEEQGEAGRWRP